MKLTLVEGKERCLAQTVSWSLNTDREVADVTPLGEGFRKNHAVLVSGSGSLECLFDAGVNACDENAGVEHSVYLHQLVLRQEIGAQFKGCLSLLVDSMPMTLKERNGIDNCFKL